VSDVCLTSFVDKSSGREVHRPAHSSSAFCPCTTYATRPTPRKFPARSTLGPPIILPPYISKSPYLISIYCANVLENTSDTSGGASWVSRDALRETLRVSPQPTDDIGDEGVLEAKSVYSYRIPEGINEIDLLSTPSRWATKSQGY